MGWDSFDDDERGPGAARAMSEAENGVRQAHRLAALIVEGLVEPRAFRLTPSILRELNEYAVAGISPNAGHLRERSDLEISGSRHVLPPHEDVPVLVAEACELVRARWDEDPLFLAAYVLWRICWIHPFDDGNAARRAPHRISFCP